MVLTEVRLTASQHTANSGNGLARTADAACGDIEREVHKIYPLCATFTIYLHARALFQGLSCTIR